ncbi:DUF3187 family protein [Pedobacter rhizosphaerae]|uniref:Outer membrane protein beta-barrel domain-containing protein n=1 Tax=Pedobacter rhizosphaerae TaxID=390241 RepID=A0A1H9MLH6_9SPHI|nr:DUF3187 family protein [Pedobacter rhizosphaerae]SER24554.1 hypothetical protein SAMN04488023_10636 [Pedobacter rhizosphaerae]
MKVKTLTPLAIALTFNFFNLKSSAQTTSSTQTKVVLFEGIVAAGYVDHGAYINCTGPGLKVTKKPYMLMVGLLPSLRIKEDQVAAGATKNSMVTPNLGFGLTTAFKHIAFQLPFYYNTKTSTKNGSWKLGVGLGYKL